MTIREFPIQKYRYPVRRAAYGGHSAAPRTFCQVTNLSTNRRALPQAERQLFHRVWHVHHRAVRAFARHAFPESHAHSFALLAYASSWLKCHHPAAFLASWAFEQPANWILQLLVCGPRCSASPRGSSASDVCASIWEATLASSAIDALAVRLGINNINGIEREAA